MRAPIFQVDAFTTRRFAGNPAAVMLLVAFLKDAVLQAIAAENNLSETAFLVPEGDDDRVRWLIRTTEVPRASHTQGQALPSALPECQNGSGSTQAVRLVRDGFLHKKIRSC